MISNEVLSELFTANLVDLGINEADIRSGKDHGSIDLGNVSRHCPAIHPFIQVTHGGELLHTEEFRDQAMTPQAFEGMLLGAKALANTAYDVMIDSEVLQRVRNEFREHVQAVNS